MDQTKKRESLWESLISCAGIVLLLALYIFSYKDCELKGAAVVQVLLCVGFLVAGGVYSRAFCPGAVLRRLVFYVALVPLLSFAWIATFQFVGPYEQDLVALLYSMYQGIGKLLVPVWLSLLVIGEAKMKRGEPILLLTRGDKVFYALTGLLFLVALLVPRYGVIWWYFMGCCLFLVCNRLWEDLLKQAKHPLLWKVIPFGFLFLRALYLIAVKAFLYTLAI